MGREFTPFEVGERFRISPPGTPTSRDARIDLVMAPGAFGSGEHETSASCLELLAELPDPKGARILDLGSGTGILAIAALKLGARSALCVDVDPAAVRTCRLNCELNGVGDRVEHACGTIDEVAADRFEMVLANLHGDILLRVAEVLVARTRPGGALLLSGILYEDNFDVRRRYRELGCTVLRNRLLEEFTTVLLRRGSEPDLEAHGTAS
jgi:ribosomal protein L11 methyltransferase